MSDELNKEIDEQQARIVKSEVDLTAPITSDLELLEVPVTLKGTRYTLVELDGTEREAYIQWQVQKTRDRNGKKLPVIDLRGMHAKLIHMSLHLGDRNGPLVAETEIQGWGGHLTKRLFKRAQLISGLDTDAEDREGND
jgi:hypothetical protein